MPKLYKYAAIALMSILIIPALAVQVSAQQQSSNKISGKYVNSAWGTEIVFPAGWTGVETSNSNTGFSVSVVNNATKPAATIIMEGWHKTLGKPESMPDWLHRHTPHEMNCVIDENNPMTGNPYGVTTNLNGMNATVVVQECNLPGVAGIKTKNYGVETADKAVVLSLSASSGLPTGQYFEPNFVPVSQPNNYSKYLGSFESSAKTFKVSWAPAAKEEPQNPTPSESVVPEFPVQVIVATAAIMGLVAILGRTKLIGTNNIRDV